MDGPESVHVERSEESKEGLDGRAIAEPCKAHFDDIPQALHHALGFPVDKRPNTLDDQLENPAARGNVDEPARKPKPNHSSANGVLSKRFFPRNVFAVLKPLEQVDTLFVGRAGAVKAGMR